jgi:DNA-directed RNA polymerase subunit RPC12/RpoP
MSQKHDAEQWTGEWDSTKPEVEHAGARPVVLSLAAIRAAVDRAFDVAQSDIKYHGKLSRHELTKALEAEFVRAAPENKAGEGARPPHEAGFEFIKAEAERTAGKGVLGEFWAACFRAAEQLRVRLALDEAVKATKSLVEQEHEAERIPQGLMEFRMRDTEQAGARPPQEYRCPNCGQTLKFNEWSGSVCPYCNYILAERRAESAESLLSQLRAVVEKWRGQQKGWLLDQPNYSKAQVFSACADELDAFIRRAE